MDTVNIPREWLHRQHLIITFVDCVNCPHSHGRTHVCSLFRCFIDEKETATPVPAAGTSRKTLAMRKNTKIAFCAQILLWLCPCAYFEWNWMGLLFYLVRWAISYRPGCTSVATRATMARKKLYKWLTANGECIRGYTSGECAASVSSLSACWATATMQRV